MRCWRSVISQPAMARIGALLAPLWKSSLEEIQIADALDRGEHLPPAERLGVDRQRRCPPPRSPPPPCAAAAGRRSSGVVPAPQRIHRPGQVFQRIADMGHLPVEDRLDLDRPASKGNCRSGSRRAPGSASAPAAAGGGAASGSRRARPGWGAARRRRSPWPSSRAAPSRRSRGVVAGMTSPRPERQRIERRDAAEQRPLLPADRLAMLRRDGLGRGLAAGHLGGDRERPAEPLQSSSRNSVSGAGRPALNAASIARYSVRRSVSIRLVSGSIRTIMPRLVPSASACNRQVSREAPPGMCTRSETRARPPRAAGSGSAPPGTGSPERPSLKPRPPRRVADR